jgi:hypothetical protein
LPQSFIEENVPLTCAWQDLLFAQQKEAIMSTNLVAAIMQALTPEATGKIASSLGLEQSAVQRGITAGVPGMLAGLANSVSSPDGAQRLASAVSHMEDMPSADLVRGVADSNHRSLADTGWSTISSLIGGGSLDTLSSIIAQFAGFGQGTAKRLLGLLAPVVLGFLRREQVLGGLDSHGLASLLASQRDNIERAIPPGVARRLEDTEAQIPQAGRAGTFNRPAARPQDPSRNWAYWLLPALIAAGAALYLLPAQHETRTAQEINKNTNAAAKDTAAPQRETQTAATPPAANIAANLENDIVANIARLRTSLQTIKDPASSQAALGELKDISGRFGRLRAQAQQLPLEARKAIAAAVAAKVPDMNSLIDRMGAQMNVSEEAKPAMDNLKSDLVSISKV